MSMLMNKAETVLITKGSHTHLKNNRRIEESLEEEFSNAMKTQIP